MFEAARLTDPIAHTSALTGFLLGAVAGIALIAAVAFATFTCGFGVALLAGMAAGLGASALLGLGEALGRAHVATAGKVTSGSHDVYINSLAAAYATSSTVACDNHGPVPLVAEGSSNVFINNLPAARKDDATTCGARIGDGSSNVFIGGGRQAYMPIADEVPEWLRTTVDWAFTLAGLVGGLAGLVRNMGGLSRAMLPCAARFIGGFVLGEAIGRYVAAPVVRRVMGGLSGHPVDVTTGRKILLANEEIDFVVQSPMPFVCMRFYASNLAFDSTLGRGWILPWEMHLRQRGGKIWLADAQGRETGFPILAPGQVSFSETEQRYLTCTRDGRYIMVDLNEMYYDFGHLDVTGTDIAWLRRVEDRTGQWHAYTRDGSGCVQTITTGDGQEMRLHYSLAPTRLVRIERTSGGTPGPLVEYQYDELAQLATVIDTNGIVARQFTYTHGLMSSHTNALGFRCSYEWAEVAGTQRVVTCSTSEGAQTIFHHDPESRRTWIEDDLGRTASWRYDTRFQVVACTDLDGNDYHVDFDEAGMPTKIMLPGDREVVFEYDNAKRIVRETDPLGRVTQTAYDGNSLRVGRLTLPDGNCWRASYDYLGRLQETTDPLCRHDRYEYGPDLSPRPLAHVDARGGRQQMEWDKQGQLVAYTDCSGKTTRYQYDGDGYLGGVTDALGQTTRYQRLRSGEVTRLTLPDGSAEDYVYDNAGLLVEQRRGNAQTRHWTRNARGQVLDATDPAGRHLLYRYDRHGRLIELASSDSTRFRFSYDEGDRLVHEIRPDGVERRLRHDTAGELILLEKIGVSTEQSPASARPRRTTRFERDKVGRLQAQHTETATTRYHWDVADRLVGAMRVPTDTGSALGVVGSEVRFDYDKAGRLVAEHGAEGIVNYAFDDLDNVTSLRLPHDQHVETLAYGSGHVHQICSGERVISDFERDDLHREVMRTQGGLTQRIGYDQLGRRAWQSAGHGPDLPEPGQGRLWRDYRYAPSGELAEQRDALRGSIQFQYDRAGYLQRQTRHAEYFQEQFAWDAASNLLAGISQKSKGHVDGNRLKVWQDLRFEYDPWGNLKVKRKGARQTQRFIFDADDRLVAMTTETFQGSLETRFEYDPLGRRIKVVHARTLTDSGGMLVQEKRFVWQGLRMVQEVREHGVSTYVYNPDAAYTPLARLDAVIGSTLAAAIEKVKRSASMYHFHTDLVGTPLEVTDEAGELAWAGRYTTWGKVEMGEDAALIPRIDQPLRYPGQYADEGTGLHYNTFRFYDPDTGRFISQDPIGLLGGENLYSYAPNPVRWADPWGLSYGAVDFAGSPDLFPVTGRQQNIVSIELQGSRTRDFTLAYKEAGFTPAEAAAAKKAGYTWHHVRNYDPMTGRSDMQLVLRTTHEATYPHAGSAEQFAKAHGVAYDSVDAVAYVEDRGRLRGRPTGRTTQGC